jgi:hypothetical protein
MLQCTARSAALTVFKYPVKIVAILGCISIVHGIVLEQNLIFLGLDFT